MTISHRRREFLTTPLGTAVDMFQAIAVTSCTGGLSNKSCFLAVLFGRNRRFAFFHLESKYLQNRVPAGDAFHNQPSD